jgi:multimeric flavodoxin WrbA
MKIEYYHDSKWGNGAAVAEEFKQLMSAKGASVVIHAVKETDAKRIPPADLYVFSSPGRWGGPTWRITRFLKKLKLPKGTKYAILTTEGAPVPNKKTGKMPTEEELAKWHKIIPKMNKILEGKGLVKMAEGKVLINNMKGPIEEGWQKKVAAFADAIPVA